MGEQKPTIEDFTTNEEFDALSAGDPTMETVGFVDLIEGTKTVGNPKKSLFKLILSNDQGRRIRVLLWEANAVKFEPLISYREIVHIKRGKVLPVKQEFAKGSENLVPFEISIQRNTTVELKGKYEDAGQANVVAPCYHEVKLRNVANTSGLICVVGYIKIVFENQVSGLSSYATGAITDGTYKLRVQVAQMQVDNDLREGVHIRVQGELKKDGFGSIFLLAHDNRSICIIDDEIMSASDLRKGFRQTLKHPITTCEDEKENLDILKKKKTKAD